MQNISNSLPVIILVHPQMGENIGAAARVMSNFSFEELRLVSPRDGWPNNIASAMAAHGRHVIDKAKVFPTLNEAIADINYLIATSSQSRYLNKKVIASQDLTDIEHNLAGKTAIMFGCERVGLTNAELQMADTIVTIPVSSDNPSLNLAQAVAICTYEFSVKLKSNHKPKRKNALKQDLEYFFSDLETKLITTGFLRHEKLRDTMQQNIRNLFIRAELTDQELRTLHGIINSLYKS
jgi:tRNA/rRNA methyltransferase